MTKREIVISEERAWAIFELLEEMNDFLHRAQHSEEEVKRWLEGGVYASLNNVFYDTVATWFEADESGHVAVPPGVVPKFRRD
jgi:hypothetical protein